MLVTFYSISMHIYEVPNHSALFIHLLNNLLKYQLSHLFSTADKISSNIREEYRKMRENRKK